jgi:hypothetical protein
MGQAKKDWMRQEDQGYSDVNGLVCLNCINDPALRKLHKTNSGPGRCDFCSNEDSNVASAIAMQKQIMRCLHLDYQDIQLSDAPYESREGGYQIRFEPAEEIIRNQLAQVVSEEFTEAIAAAVGFTEWCERDWAILSEPLRLSFGWRRFCHTVKHRLRFSFAWDPGEEEPGHPDHVKPSLVLEQLGDFVDSLRLVKTLPIGTTIYRTRIDRKKTYTEFQDLGAPPHDLAKSNRMSPAGIPMFYGSDLLETAIDETWDRNRAAKASIGVFKTIRVIRVIDFACLPEQPSYWDPEKRKAHHQISFLKNFASELSLPIDRGSLVDLHYTPTQIVSEYLTKGRFPPKLWNDTNDREFSVHGIAFKSSRSAGSNYAFNFVNNCDKYLGFEQSHFLKLEEVVHQSLNPQIFKGLISGRKTATMPKKLQK